MENKIIKRNIEWQMSEMSKKVPVVTILGPRQSGKTTTVKNLFPNYNYANLEDMATRELAMRDYEGFFSKYREPLIIDEVQRVPELLSAIQVRVDSDRNRNGRFVLTGSHQPRLRAAVAQSLAGRTTLLTLYPLSISEIASSETKTDINDIDKLLLTGFMPELYHKNSRSPEIFYRDYLDTYVERDLRQMIAVKNLNTFVRFLKLLAGRVGQIINMNSLSSDAGVSVTTISEWISVLEDSYVIFRLQPYFSNISKRLVKSPKVYFTEPGLCAYLLGIESANQMSRDPLRGNLFENMVIAEAMKTRLNANREPELYFLRTEKGVEIDMILKKEGILYPFEIKASMTPLIDYGKWLKSFMKAEVKASDPRIIYAGEPYASFGGIEYVSYKNVKEAII